MDYLLFMAAGARFRPQFIGGLRALVLDIVILLVVIICYQAILDSRRRKMAGLRKSVREAVGRIVSGTGANMSEADKDLLFTERGLGELLHLMDEMTPEAKDGLRQLLHQVRYESFVNKQLDAQDPEYLSLVVRMIAHLNLTELDERVGAILYAFQGDIALQYEAFKTLSILGCTEPLLHILMDDDFVQGLTFRSLQYILGVYSGDREQLYAYLLHAPDPYVRRTCIKLIGTDNMIELAPEVVQQLEQAEGINLIIDSVRCLGQLKYKQGIPSITQHAHHERWEVRAIVATALGQIDPDASSQVLVDMLCDPEWQVRSNAGAALQRAGLLQRVAAQVEATGDSFAMDMLRYMTQTSLMWRGAE